MKRFASTRSEKRASHPDAGCAIFTTSGTTKAPKFVLHDQKTLVGHAFDVMRGFGLGPPRFALGRLKKSAAATRQGDKDKGADEIQTNSTRHARQSRLIYLRTLQHVVFTHF